MERGHKLGLIEIHLAVFLFGLSGLLGKMLSVPPLVIVLGRTVFAALTLLIILVLSKTRLRFKSGKDLIILIVMGILLALHWFTFFQSIKVSNVAIGLITFSSFPLFVTFMEPYFFKERLRLFSILMAVLVFSGLLLVIPSFDIKNNITAGVVWGVLSGFTFAILSLANRKVVSSYPPTIIAFFQNSIAAITLFPFLCFVEFAFQPLDYILLPVLGIFCTAAAFTLFIQSLSHLKAQLVSIITCLEPVYGILLAILIINEIPTLRTWLGGALILGTIFVASFKRS